MFADDLLPAAQPVCEHQDEIVKTVFIERDQKAFSERIVELVQVTAPLTKPIVASQIALFHCLAILELPAPSHPVLSCYNRGRAARYGT